MSLRLENLTKRFGQTTVVDGVSFSVEKGELTALLGPSGSGKSTLLRMIAGLERPDGGRLWLGGEEITGKAVQKRSLGFVFQNYALFKHLTVERNIAFGLEIRKVPSREIRQRVESLLELVKLADYGKHYPHQLSGGQRQRVALARALAPRPEVLLLDEPFGALDAKVRSSLAQWLREIHSRLGTATLFVTHDQNEAIEISDRIVVINRGRVEQIGGGEEVYDKPSTRFVASFIGNVNILEGFLEDERISFSGVEETLAASGRRGSGPVVILVRPEELSLRKLGESGENLFPGTVQTVSYRGSFFQVEVRVGEMVLRAVEEKRNFHRHEWREGERVEVSLEGWQYFEVPEGHEEIREKLRQLGYIE